MAEAGQFALCVVDGGEASDALVIATPRVPVIAAAAVPAPIFSALPRAPDMRPPASRPAASPTLPAPENACRS